MAALPERREMIDLGQGLV